MHKEEVDRLLDQLEYAVKSDSYVLSYSDIDSIINRLDRLREHINTTYGARGR